MRAPLILAALLSFASAQETMIRQVYDTKTDTHVEVTALFTRPSMTGFLPVRVKISNNLAKQHTAKLDFSSGQDYDNRLKTQSSFSLTAPPQKAVTQDFMVPVGVINHSRHTRQHNITANLSGSLGKESNTIRAEITLDMPGVLMSESLFTVNGSQLDAEISKSKGSSYSSSAFAGKFDPKQMPNEWLAYSGYDSIMMSDIDWSNVPASGRNAILSWVNLGGQLVIYSSSRPTLTTLGLPQDPGYGTCRIEQIGSDLKLTPSAAVDLVTKENPNSTSTVSICNDYNSSWPLQAHFGLQGFHYGLFIAVLVVFGIMVGPVNLFVFAKSGQRHKLFITTPLISLVTSLILILLIIAQDGFGGKGMRRVLMEVRPDAGQNAAFVHQEQISRTGILTRSRFTVEPTCAFLPVPIATSRWARFTNDNDTNGQFNLQPNNGKMMASGDWWQSRSEHGHALTAVIPTRGRIESTNTPGEFVSTFDFPIQTIYYLDSSKTWHRADAILTGKPFTLTPIDSTMAEPTLAKEVSAFAARNSQFLARAKNRPGHFVAVTNQAPGIDTHPGIHWEKTQTVITGPVANR